MASSHTAFFESLKSAGPTRGDAIARMEVVAHLLDTAFVLPGTKQRVGIDAIIGLIPGVGDILTTLLSTYIIWEAKQLGLPKRALGRMMLNLGIHATVGTLPFAGDAFDAFFRVNQRNMRIVREHLGLKPGRRGPSEIDGEARRL
jgi:hypothetical protein